jgi:hypothetical protein
MAERQGERLIQVRAGVGEPAAMRAVPGEVLGPLSVGHSGGWRVVALGVRDEHAFLYFDGETLFVQSVDAGNPVFINAAPVSTEWTSVEPHSELALGDARLWYAPSEAGVAHQSDRPFPPGAFVNEDSNRRGDRPFLPPQHAEGRPMERPFAPGALVTQDEDMTRLAPIEDAAGNSASQGPPRPAAGRPAPRGGGTVQMAALPVALARGAAPAGMVTSGPNDLTTMGPVQPPAGHVAPPGMGAPMGNDAAVMMPAVAPQYVPQAPQGPMSYSPNAMPMQGMPGSGMPPGALPATGMTTPATPAPGAAGAGKKPIDQLKQLAERAKVGWNEAPLPRKAIIVLAGPVLAASAFLFLHSPEPPRPPPRPRPPGTAPAGTAAGTAPAATTGIVARPPPSAVPIASGSAAALSPSALPAASAIPSSGPATPPTGKPGKTPPQKTLQRAAADAVAAGAWADAATLYEQLAAQYPDQPAYAEAARIMRARASGK